MGHGTDASALFNISKCSVDLIMNGRGCIFDSQCSALGFARQRKALQTRVVIPADDFLSHGHEYGYRNAFSLLYWLLIVYRLIKWQMQKKS